jgi:phage protein U
VSFFARPRDLLRSVEQLPVLPGPLGRAAESVIGWVVDLDRAAEGRRGVPGIQGAVFVQLGAVVFETTGPLTDFEGEVEHEYAEQKPIEGKAQLQFVGDALEGVTLSFLFSELFCDPGRSLAELRTLAQRHEAVPLVWASGKLEGRYVVRRLGWTVHETDREGRPRRISGRVSLQEWAEPPAIREERRVRRSTVTKVPAPGGAVKKALPRRPSSAQAANPRGVPVSQITRKGS